MSRRNIVHIEIPTTNPGKSADFYEKLFGWHIERDDQMDYTMWEPEEGPGGGFSPVIKEGEDSPVLLYVNSQDIDADLDLAASIGGKIIEKKTEIPETGWFGLFKDPSGSIIGLYTSMHHHDD